MRTALVPVETPSTRGLFGASMRRAPAPLLAQIASQSRAERDGNGEIDARCARAHEAYRSGRTRRPHAVLVAVA
jgi:hypothetical protein